MLFHARAPTQFLNFNITKADGFNSIIEICKPWRSNIKCRVLERQGYASVLYEEDVNVKSLIKYVEELNQNNEKYKTALKNIMEKKQLKQSFKIFQRHDEIIMPL